jgi:hypothetical protein
VIVGGGRGGEQPMESELRDRVVCLSHLSLSESSLRLTRSGICSDLTDVVEKRIEKRCPCSAYSVLLASYSCQLTTWKYQSQQG